MKTILVIEDNKDVRENIEEILQLSDYKVITAADGKKGVDMAIKKNPDLIICDIMMPVLDGYGVLHSLSKRSETASIPFIFLTAKTERNDLRKGMEMGADDYITKPFDDAELLNAVETRLKKSERLKQEFNNSLEGMNEMLLQAKKINSIDLINEEREIRKMKKKEFVYEQQQRPSYLFYIKKGKVKTYKTNDDGKELITRIIKDGEFFGYTDLIEERTYQESAEALEETEVMMIPKDDFFLLINNSPEVSKKFIRLLTDNVSERENNLLQLAYNSVRKRVADSLLMVNEKYKSNTIANPAIKISRDDLASIVGTATESLIRTLGDFKDEKLIDVVDGGKIQILNENKLRNLLG